jgi:hypothetical protein
MMVGLAVLLAVAVGIGVAVRVTKHDDEHPLDDAPPI